MKRYIPLILFVASAAQAQVFIAQGETTAALKRMPVALVQAADGYTPQTGVTISAGECKISKSGGAEANCAGTLTELAGGLYYYEAADAELDTIGYISVRIADAAARQFVGVANIGLSDANFWAEMFTRNTGKTYADAVTGSPVKELATNVTATSVGTVTGNVNGNVLGSVNSVVTDVGANVDPADISAAVWNDQLYKYAQKGSAGKILSLLAELMGIKR